MATRVLSDPGRFELRYRHSYYRAEAAESFMAGPDGSIRLVAVGSLRQAVLDHYGLAGRTHRQGGWLRLELRQPPRFERLPLAPLAVHPLRRSGVRHLLEAWHLADPGGLVYVLLLRAWAVSLAVRARRHRDGVTVTPIITFTPACGGARIERLETRPADAWRRWRKSRGTDDAGSSPRRWWSSVSS